MNALRLAGTGLLFLALAVPAQAQKDKKKDDKKVGEVLDAEKALRPGHISGKVSTATETSLILRVEYEHLELKDPKAANKINTAGNRQLEQVLRAQQQMANARDRMMRARNQQEYYRALQDLQRIAQQAELNAYRQQLNAASKAAANSPFKVVTEHKDFSIDLSGKVEFRVSDVKFLPTSFDEFGNIKKPDPDETKKLKGPGNLPGYKASANEVKPGAKVTVTLAKDKDADNKLRGTVVLVTTPGEEPVKEQPKKPAKKKNK